MSDPENALRNHEVLSIAGLLGRPGRAATEHCSPDHEDHSVCRSALHIAEFHRMSQAGYVASMKSTGYARRMSHARR